MATQKGVLDLSYKAAGDLSAYQFHFVKFSAADTVDLCGANERACGILQNNPDTAGMAAHVRHIGTSKLVVAEAITPQFTMLTSTSAGHGEEADAADEWVAALSIGLATAANDIITVLLHFFDAVSSDA